MSVFSDLLTDASTLFSAAASYAATNIKPELVKITADAMDAAEAAFAADPGVDRYAVALEAAGVAAAKDGVQFIEADFNYAVEALNQARAAASAPVDNTAAGTTVTTSA